MNYTVSLLQKAARASDRDKDTYLEKVRSNLVRGWYLCDRLEVRATSVWQTATGKSIGRTLITTVDITPTDVTNRVNLNTETAEKTKAEPILVVSAEGHIFGL